MCVLYVCVFSQGNPRRARKKAQIAAYLKNRRKKSPEKSAALQLKIDKRSHTAIAF